MWLRFKYFMSVYITFINFLEEHDDISDYRHYFKKLSIIKFIYNRKVCDYIPYWIISTITTEDSNMNLLSNKWCIDRARCEDVYIYSFLDFLNQHKITNEFKHLINQTSCNTKSYTLEKHLLTTSKTKYITFLIQDIHGEEYAYWFKYHNQWLNYIKELN